MQNEYSEDKEEGVAGHIRNQSDESSMQRGSISSHRSKMNGVENPVTPKSVSQIRQLLAEENFNESISDYMEKFGRWNATDVHDAQQEIAKNNSWKLLHCYTQAFTEETKNRYDEHHWEFLRSLFLQHINQCRASPHLASACTAYSNVISFTCLIHHIEEKDPAAAKALVKQAHDVGLMYYLIASDKLENR